MAVFATLPFGFEGRRRREQALAALDQLQEQADLVVCFENDRMPALSDPASGIEDAFQAVDSMLAQSVRAVCGMTRRRGVLHSGLDEIAAVVKGGRSTALFGFGAADGEERARAAVARAFANPLLDAGGAFSTLERLWVYVAGGTDMRLAELQTVMEAVLDQVGQGVRLYLGTAVDSQMAGALSVTLIAGLPAQGELVGLAGGAGEVALSVQSVSVSSSVPTAADVLHFAPNSAQTAPNRAQIPASEYREVEGRSNSVGGPVFVEDLQPEALHGSASDPGHLGAPGGHDVQGSDVFEESIRGDGALTELRATLSPVETHGVLGDSGHFSSGHAPSGYYADETMAHVSDSQAAASPETYPDDAWESESSAYGADVPAEPALNPRSLPVPPYERAKERRREEGQVGVGMGRGVEVGSNVPPREAPVLEEREEVREVVRQRAEVESRPLVQRPAEAGGAGSNLSTTAPTPPESNVRRSKETVQEQLSFEPVSRGRFEKTDRTIVDGEDLDVPTFMRQGVPLE